jgi:hypothetical protein
MIILFALFTLTSLELIYSLVIHQKRSGHTFYTNPKIKLWKYDKRRGYKFAPNINLSAPTAPIKNAPRRIFFKNIRTDQYGFRFTENINILIGQTDLIFCVGDSTTICMESTNEESWPYLLDKELAPQFRVINAAAGAYRSIHQRYTVEYILKNFKPSDIILHTGINDFQYRSRPGYHKFDVNAHPLRNMVSKYPFHNFLFRRFGLYHMLYSRLSSVYKSFYCKIKPANEKIPDVKELLSTPSIWVHELESNILEINSLCNAHNTRLWLILFMTPFFETQNPEVIKFSEEDLNMDGRWQELVEMKKILRSNLLRIANEAEIFTIDIDTAFSELNLPFKERFEYFVDRFHTSPNKGNPFMAEIIAENIRRELSLH